MGDWQKFIILQVTSQHPYAEVYIGKPHVYTIDVHNLTEVRMAVEEILRQDEVREGIDSYWSSFLSATCMLF